MGFKLPFKQFHTNARMCARDKITRRELIDAVEKALKRSNMNTQYPEVAEKLREVALTTNYVASGVFIGTTTDGGIKMCGCPLNQIGLGTLDMSVLNRFNDNRTAQKFAGEFDKNVVHLGKNKRSIMEVF